MGLQAPLEPSSQVSHVESSVEGVTKKTSSVASKPTAGALPTSATQSTGVSPKTTMAKVQDKAFWSAVKAATGCKVDGATHSRLWRLFFSPPKNVSELPAFKTMNEAISECRTAFMAWKMSPSAANTNTLQEAREKMNEQYKGLKDAVIKDIGANKKLKEVSVVASELEPIDKFVEKMNGLELTQVQNTTAEGVTKPEKGAIKSDLQSAVPDDDFYKAYAKYGDVETKGLQRFENRAQKAIKMRISAYEEAFRNWKIQPTESNLEKLLASCKAVSDFENDGKTIQGLVVTEHVSSPGALIPISIDRKVGGYQEFVISKSKDKARIDKDIKAIKTQWEALQHLASSVEDKATFLLDVYKNTQDMTKKDIVKQELQNIWNGLSNQQKAQRGEPYSSLRNALSGPVIKIKLPPRQG